jgi:hypothetical protein
MGMVPLAREMPETALSSFFLIIGLFGDFIIFLCHFLKHIFLENCPLQRGFQIIKYKAAYWRDLWLFK